MNPTNAMPPTPKSITVQNGLLRVEFCWAEDRFEHFVQLRAKTDHPWRTVLQSCEGDPSQIWPPSPPFQEVESHSGPAGQTSLLAVGLAGNSHWSASVEEVLDNELEDDRLRGIRFDVACRLKTPNPTLVSRYRFAEGIRSIPTKTGLSLKLQSAENNAKLIIVTDSATDREESMLTIRPHSIPDGQPVTARWMYDFVITSQSG